VIGEASVVRLLLTVLLAGGTAALVDRWTELRGFLPPAFENPWRRAAAFLVVASILFLGVFLPLALLGRAAPVTPADVSGPRVFLLQGLLVLSLLTWFVLGYAGRGGRRLLAQLARQLGWRAERPGFELALGLAAGAAGWVAVIALVVAVAAVIWLLGGEELLPKAPPDVIPLIAGLPLGMRIGLGLSAGVVEETFFRGFLQPRVGIPLSTGLFVLAHLSYEQPFMLVGITALSLLFAFLVRWRRTVLPAIAAHAAFDLVQLLFIIPWVLQKLPAGGLESVQGWLH
jgi:membrane protease YdiL (CAAX protease family)